MCKEPAVQSEVREIKRRLDDLETRLNGNDRPGIVERLAGLERANATQTWLLRTVVGGMITNFIGIVVLLLKVFIGR